MNPKRMPKRLSTNDVREEFERYGYSLPEDFIYRNNTTPINVIDEQTGTRERLTLKQLRYKINHGRSEYDFPQFMNMALSDNEPKSSFERFSDKQDEYYKNESDEFREQVFHQSRNMIKSLMKQKDFKMNFDGKIDSFLYSLMLAIKETGPRINKDIRMTIIDENNNVQYYHANKNTVDFLQSMFEVGRDISDSNTVALDKFIDVKEIHFEFRDLRQGRRINAGFFPFINKSDVDLKKFGIFKSESESGINESCLIQSFMASNLFSDNEINMLKSYIQTRTVPRTELKKISELLKVCVSCKINNSCCTYAENYDKKIDLIIIDGHYMLNDRVNVTEFYIRNHKRINEDQRFKNHPRKFMLQKFDDKRYSFAKKGLSINQAIKIMKQEKLLVPMDQAVYNKLCWSYEAEKKPFNNFRKIIVSDKKQLPEFVKKTPHTKSFFGYDPEPSEIQKRLDEVQDLVNSLKININVRRYYKFSELMQKIMFEFGCYGDVYELSGDDADRIRSDIIFPKTLWSKIHLKQKLYYIDQAGAYMSNVTSIPTGIPNADGTFNGENTKIKDLIHLLYNKRMEAKNGGNDKLATTIKFMMNSCFGYSIKKPNYIKHKHVGSVNEYIETFAPYVLKYSYNKDGVSGFVDTVNPYVEYYSVPQFARSIMNNFNDKMNELKSMVHVYYSKVDSALVSEDDFLLLKDKGYIGDDLGKFKVEHVFTEVYFRSAENWIGKHEDGSYFYHSTPKLKDYCMTKQDPIKALMEL